MLKEQVLSALCESGGVVSGNELAEKYSVTRMAVWKAVESLKAEGYDIESVRKSGYRLVKNSDILSRTRLVTLLKHSPRLVVCDTLASTDILARSDVESDYAVVAANRQTAGVSKSGEVFLSPAEKGLYFSLTRKTDLTAQRWQLAEAGVYRACEKVFQELGVLVIRRENVFLCDDKRIAALSIYRSMLFEQIICMTAGVGVNVYAGEFGRGGNWTSLYAETGTYFNRSELLARFANEIYENLEDVER